jgi:hypothetical protein
MQRLQRPHIHKLNGFDDPTKCFFVSKILEGFKRKNPGSKDLRMPVSSALLKQLINSLPHVCKFSFEASMFASAFSLNNILNGDRPNICQFVNLSKLSKDLIAEL